MAACRAFLLRPRRMLFDKANVDYRGETLKAEGRIASFQEACDLTEALDQNWRGDPGCLGRWLRNCLTGQEVPRRAPGTCVWGTVAWISEEQAHTIRVFCINVNSQVAGIGKQYYCEGTRNDRRFCLAERQLPLQAVREGQGRRG